jgi:hypothetical protein
MIMSSHSSLLPSSSLSLAILALLVVSAPSAGAAGASQNTVKEGLLLDVGPRDRFWRHHVTEESLLYNGVNYYHDIRSCIDDSVTPEERLAAKTSTTTATTSSSTRKARSVIRDPIDNTAMLVVVENALLPIHVKLVQTLATCVRTFLPHLYESRAMYQEMDLDEDTGLGGNCPTHLAPLVGVFVPDVVEEMYRTLQTAYDAAGWKRIVDIEQRDHALEREVTLFPPQDLGMRASEHLTYRDFPRLAEHNDGHTTYTMNFAFVGPEDYEGGEFFILGENVDGSAYRRFVKPNKYEAMVFLGGRYLHGVNEIKGGHREMYSTEFWPYPDTPFGSSLWSNFPKNMEDYVDRCNMERKAGNLGPCKAEWKLRTVYHDNLDEVKNKYSSGDDARQTQEEDDVDTTYNYDKKGRKLPPPVHDGIDRKKDHTERPNRVRPSHLKAVHVIYGDDDGNQFDSRDFKNRRDEPDFYIPKKLSPGEMHPIRWREDLSPIDGSDGESFVVGFPPELHQEFLKYVKEAGMMKLAYDLLYKEKALVAGEQRIYVLDDGETWTAMVQGSWKNDMIWLDPGDESAFESVLAVLRRGGFDVVLDSIARTFDLKGLMVQGIGAIFLSKYDYTENMHVDINGSRGSFYNVIVPVHIPENDVAIFKLADQNDDTLGTIKLDPSFGVVLGGESRHGTGECDYRAEGGFRLSFAVYVADINEENIELISSDSTSLWPTEGDIDWFRAQKGRLWSKDGENSLKNDKGREPMNVQDHDEDCPQHKDLCETDLTGKRLECPKTCQLYLEDDKYYAKFFPGRQSPNAFPTCTTSDEPSCKDQNKQQQQGTAATA